MARIRTLKPEFWTDGNVVRMSAHARLLYIGSWNFACDGGHLPDDAMALKLKVLPADPVDPEELLEEVIKLGRMTRRKLVDGRSYLAIPRFGDHQKVDPRWKSRCPYCLAETGPAEPSGNPDEPPWDSPDLPEPHRNSPESHPNSPELALGVDWSGVDTKEKQAPQAAPGAPSDAPPRRRGTRISPDFTATADMIAWAKKNTPSVGAAETATFVDYWLGESGARASKLDWVAAWRKWMRTAQERKPGSSWASSLPASNAPSAIPAAEKCLEHPAFRADACPPCKSEEKARRAA